MHRILNAWTRRFADPHLPRSLTPRLHRTGFTIINRDAHTILNPEYDPQTYSVTNTAIMALRRHPRHTPPSEIEDWLNDLQQLGNEGRYFFSLTRYLFTATRTQPRTSLPAAGAENSRPPMPAAPPNRHPLRRPVLSRAFSGRRAHRDDAHGPFSSRRRPAGRRLWR